jgi:hypothetical protein
MPKSGFRLDFSVVFSVFRGLTPFRKIELFRFVWPSDAVAREIMGSHAKRLHRIVSPANGKVVRIVAGQP